MPARQPPAAPARAQLCKRLRHRQSDCRICVEVCPEGAITLDPGPAVSEQCTRCGLCQSACPTEVFQGGVHSDQRLLGRVGPRLRREGSVAGGGALFLHCGEAEPLHRESLSVPCLGSLGEAFLLGSIALGANPLTLVRGDCGSCRLRAGEWLFDRAMAACHALAPAAGLDCASVRLVRRQRNTGPDSARRRFLLRLGGRDEWKAGDWPGPGTDGGEALQGNGLTPGRRLLQTLLRGSSWSSATLVPCDADLPWASIRIDQVNCAACGTCVNLCPTGAVTRRIEGDRLSHHFSGALCINCRLCQEACPQQVISFDPELDARELLRDGARPITHIRLHGCEICGETLPESEGRFCITCQRRGRVENHVPGPIGAI